MCPRRSSYCRWANEHTGSVPLSSVCLFVHRISSEDFILFWWSCFKFDNHDRCWMMVLYTCMEWYTLVFCNIDPILVYYKFCTWMSAFGGCIDGGYVLICIYFFVLFWSVSDLAVIVYHVLCIYGFWFSLSNL